MADNVAITPGAGATVAADDISDVLHQRVKVQHGADGSATDVSTASPLPVTDAAAATALALLLTELGQKLEAGGEVALSAASLAALETISVANFPADPATQTTLAAILAKLIAAPATEAKQDTLISHVDGLESKDFATQTTLAAILTELGQKLEPGGEVALNAASLAALESITVTVTGGATEAKQDALLTELGQKLETGGEVALDSATLTALETITVGTALPAGTNNIGDVDVASFPNASSATLSNVSDTASSTQLVASNGSRKGLLIFNDSTAAVYVKYGTTASATDYTVKIAAAQYWEMPSPIYTGRVDAIWASDASGAARITEL